MKILVRYFVCLVLAIVLLGACAQREPEQPPAAPTAQQPPQPTPATPPAQQEAATPPAQSPQAAQTSTPAPSTPQPVETKPTVTPAPATAPTPQSVPAQPEKPAPAPAKAVAKDVVILKAALGGVRFEHKLHAEARKIACETCHHASRPEKPNAAAQQACATCHATTATAPMKTKLQAAFHNPTATAGTCIDCHKAEVLQGKAPPVRCLDCHKKENK